MPNFIAKNLKNIELPASFDGVEFIWEAINGDEKLVYTKALGFEFCLVVKGRANNYVIKCDKLSRPAKLEAVQRALEAYKQLFACEVISQATAIKKSKNSNQSDYIISSDELVNRLENSKKGPAIAVYRLGEKVIPAVLLILSIAYVVEASYNPFLYFRF